MRWSPFLLLIPFLLSLPAVFFSATIIQRVTFGVAFIWVLVLLGAHLFAKSLVFYQDQLIIYYKKRKNPIAIMYEDMIDIFLSGANLSIKTSDGRLHLSRPISLKILPKVRKIFHEHGIHIEEI